MSEETTKAQEAEKKETEVKPTEVKPAETAPSTATPTSAPAAPSTATPSAPPSAAPSAAPTAAPGTAPTQATPAAVKTEEAKPAEVKPAEVKPEAKPVEKKDGEERHYYYPNKWARIIFTSAEEVMGRNGVTALLNMANMKEYIDNYPPDNMKKEFSFEKVGQLQQGIWDMSGPKGARVFATRAGEQSFKDGLSQFKSVAAAAQIAMKVGSLEAKAKIGLEFFSKFFNAVSDQVVEISEDDKHWIWTITRCPVCWGRKSEEPVCHLAVGVLQAAFAWISDNKRFRILETECKAKGDKNCVFKIEKVPVE